MACEILTVTGAGTAAVNGTYTQIPDVDSFQIWTHSSGNYCIIRLAVMGPPGYINLASYPTYTGPSSTIYYSRVYIPGPTAPACPAGVTLSVASGDPDAPTITEGAPAPDPYAPWGGFANYQRLRFLEYL